MTNIKTERERRGWTQYDLAQRAQVSQSAVSKAERGVPVQQKIMARILTALETPAEEMPAEEPFDCKAEREKRGLSQRQLARLSGITDNTIGNIERGKTKPTPYTASSLKAGLQRADEGKTKPEKILVSDKIPSDRDCALTNGDILRRRILSDEELINAGKVQCLGNRARCAGDCRRCKRDFLRMPYTGKE